jgi:hypothetical protein
MLVPRATTIGFAGSAIVVRIDVAKITPSRNGSHGFSPASLLGGTGPALRRIEMEMRIVVPEAASPSTLAERLSVVVGMERISLLDDRGQVGVRVEGASDRAVLRVIDTVERWLEERAAGLGRDVAGGALVPDRPLGTGRDLAMRRGAARGPSQRSKPETSTRTSTER